MRYVCSIVIPAHNASGTIGDLLSSIYHSQGIFLRFIEVIVIDDASLDDTISIVSKFVMRHRKLRIRIIALRKNKGPAHARNIGADLAQGNILFFLDSDVVLFSRSLTELLKSFDDPDVHALTGVWDKKQQSKGFFPQFKALRDWSYWINERDPKHYYYLFSTRVAAIRRGLFLRLGGFDDTYKSALVEDIELTYRIARRYAVIFNPKVKVHHEFEGFIPVSKKYFWRSFYWTKIYRERKKFDPVATTNKEALTTISAGAVFFFLFLSVFFLLTHVYAYFLYSISFLLLFLSIHLLGVCKFLWFSLKERGILFSFQALLVGFILYLIILGGAILSYISFFSRFTSHLTKHENIL